MDSIDAQIKSLLRKKAKIAMLRKVQDQVNGISEDSEHEGLKDEIRAFFDQIINSEVVNVQNGQSKRPVYEDVDSARGLLPQGETPPAAPRQFKPAADLVQFVRTYAHLGFKEVSATTLTGEKVRGKVMKVEYPNLLVQAESGELVEVNPESAKLEA